MFDNNPSTVSTRKRFLTAGFHLLTLALLFLVVSVKPARADFTSADWRFQKEIHVKNAVTSRFASFWVDKGIFRDSQKDLRDLRIISDAGQEIPYKILRSNMAPPATEKPAKIISSSFDDQRDIYIIDLGKVGELNSNLWLETNKANFWRRILVEGSDDLENWFMLGGVRQIFSFQDQNFRSRHTSVVYNENVYRYLRVTILDSQEDRLDIRSVAVSREKISDEKKFNIAGKRLAGLDQEPKRTNLYFDLKAPVPINQIRIVAGDQNYNRAVTVFGADMVPEKTTVWQPVGSGYIFSVQTNKFSGRQETVNFSEAQYRYIKISIINEDDNPLTVKKTRFFGFGRRVVFTLRADAAAYIAYFGNSRSAAPSYDIGKTLDYVGNDDIRRFKLGRTLDNPAYVPEKPPTIPWSEKYRALLIGAFVIGTGVLGLAVLTTWRSVVKDAR